MNRSNFSAFGSVGSTSAPDVVDVRHLLAGDVERQRVLQRERPLQKRDAKHVDRDAAGPEYERAVGVALLGHVVREVAVLDHLQPAVDRRKVAEPVLRRLLGDGHRRQLRIGQQVVADELRRRRSA